MGKGREQAIKFIKENPILGETLREQVLNMTIRKAKLAAQDEAKASAAKVAAPTPKVEKVEPKKKH